MVKCDPRAKARCPYKKQCCGDNEGYFVEGSECDKFNQRILEPPPTNADHIRSLSDEELARALCAIAGSHGCDGECVGLPYCQPGHNGMIDWLRQPWEGGYHD